MKTSDPRSWMWSEALDMLARAERIQRTLFQPHHGDAAQSPCWEPPADVMETAHEVIVITALPGVDPATITTIIDDGSLEIFGRRVLPAELQTATIHRLELPQGCFKRRLRIPPGTYDRISRVSANGCLIVTLHKHEIKR
jgi:HSP20 family protein